MKTLILTAAFIAFTVASFAQTETSLKSNDYVLNTDEISIAFYPTSTDHITMILMKNSDQRVKVRVTDADNQVLYEKKYGKVNNARIKYDISEFPSGNYTFEVLKGNKVLFGKNFNKIENTLALAK